LEKNPRKAAPYGGKIDYDIKGRLVGNWFLEGTGISIGGETGIPRDACNICQAVYGVKGNAPDPATIDAASGLVKYDLVAREFIDNTGIREPTRNAEDQVLGEFLAQVLDDTSIKVEAIPGRTSSQVTGFSESARLYHR